jgi:hypothetical protein
MTVFLIGKKRLKENMRNVIFCPVGIPIQYHPAYDKENLWRFVKPHRN